MPSPAPSPRASDAMGFGSEACAQRRQQCAAEAKRRAAARRAACEEGLRLTLWQGLLLPQDVAGVSRWLRSVAGERVAWHRTREYRFPVERRVPSLGRWALAEPEDYER